MSALVIDLDLRAAPLDRRRAHLAAQLVAYVARRHHELGETPAVPVLATPTRLRLSAPSGDEAAVVLAVRAVLDGHDGDVAGYIGGVQPLVDELAGIDALSAAVADALVSAGQLTTTAASRPVTELEVAGVRRDVLRARAELAFVGAELDDRDATVYAALVNIADSCTTVAANNNPGLAVDLLKSGAELVTDAGWTDPPAHNVRENR